VGTIVRVGGGTGVSRLSPVGGVGDVVATGGNGLGKGLGWPRAVGRMGVNGVAIPAPGGAEGANCAGLGLSARHRTKAQISALPKSVTCRSVRCKTMVSATSRWVGISWRLGAVGASDIVRIPSPLVLAGCFTLCAVAEIWHHEAGRGPRIDRSSAC